MRQPSIAIVQRGRVDRFGMQKLYLRYSWNYKTNYIALPWKVLPMDWDAYALLNKLSIDGCLKPESLSRIRKRITHRL